MTMMMMASTFISISRVLNEKGTGSGASAYVRASWPSLKPPLFSTRLSTLFITNLKPSFYVSFLHYFKRRFCFPSKNDRYLPDAVLCFLPHDTDGTRLSSPPGIVQCRPFQQRYYFK